MDNYWLVNGKLITADGVRQGALKVAQGRIAALRRVARRDGLPRVDLHGAYLAPGFIDLHVWGAPDVISREAARGGATAFLSALGPATPTRLASEVAQRAAFRDGPGAACLGLHLEGPFLSRARCGALPQQFMRRPSTHELAELGRIGGGRIRLMTLAPELPGALEAIRWCRRHGVIVSLGHSDAEESEAHRAVKAGARAVTHVFNGMLPLNHRQPTLLDAALTESRLTTMVILDGVHVSASAFRLLVRAKGIDRIALVTDSIAHQGWDVVKRSGAYYKPDGTLAGSCLTMMRAVRNAAKFGKLSIEEAVHMATVVPARLLNDRSRGRLAVGARADLVAFNERYDVQMTIVGGRVVYQRRTR